MKHTLFTICTFLYLKKLKRLNITEYKILLIKSFLKTSLLLIYGSRRSLVISKYRDSNMFRNHFRILNARMVQSVESIWTVLYTVKMSASLGLPCIYFMLYGRAKGPNEILFTECILRWNFILCFIQDNKLL